MQEFANIPTLKNAILDLMNSLGIGNKELIDILDYIIDLFEQNNLGTDYYGYHNIDHELEVTYISLHACNIKNKESKLTEDDIKYIFTSALFHDFDPEKSVDRPHEKNVIEFLENNSTPKKLISNAGLDINIVKAIIMRTVYPWVGKTRDSAESDMKKYLDLSPITSNDTTLQDHYRELGWILSLSDRIGGYALGDFSKAIELAKMNAHASAWSPTLIVKRAVMFFEDMLSNESQMCEKVLNSLPKNLRKNFLDNIVSFMKLRQEEIQIYNRCTYEGLKFVPSIEKIGGKIESEFIDALLEIYKELPKPLQFTRDDFVDSLNDKDTILNTLRIGNSKGPIIGFTKGGPLEKYNISSVSDVNFGKNNTVFLEPVALKMGYWGFHGGSEMRHLFTMQVSTKGYKFLTSFAMRDVITSRIKRGESVEFVQKFDPERWDYYRTKL
ncbi:MAG: hypothetical protein CMD65_00150 [Gammaproteobacteria bacterium]|nr:hypothetical protein [Gammaproteobacteria bacterium]